MDCTHVYNFFKFFIDNINYELLLKNNIAFMFYFYFVFVCLFVLYSALIWIHDYALNKNRCYYIIIS